MRKIAIAVSMLGVGCATPAYHAPQVPVPASYDVKTAPPLSAPAKESRAEDDSTAIHISSALASAPFWAALGDSTLTTLIAEARRANMDVRVAESRLSGARASRRLARLDLAPTITGTGSSSRFQTSLAQTPGLASQLPAVNLYDVGFDASWEVDFFGRINRNVQAQSALVESTQHGLEDVQISVAAEGFQLRRPNGIAWDPVGRRWIVLSFDQFAGQIMANPQGRAIPQLIRTRSGGGQLDGVEVLRDGAILFTSWADSSIHLLANGRDKPIIREVAVPADIGVDTKRNYVLIPLSMLGHVQLWSLDGVVRPKKP